MLSKYLTIVAIFLGFLASEAEAQGRRSRHNDENPYPRLLGLSHFQTQTGRPKTYFVDKNGVPLLTNRPAKYRSDSEYFELQITYEPVTVPAKFSSRTFDGTYTKRDIVHLVHRYARQHNISEHLVLAIIRAESNFDPYAVSDAGARGLMQLMPATAKDMHITNIHDPAQNIAGGTQYLAKLREEFGDDMDLVLAAYNAGPRAVKRYEGVPPYKETREYIRRVRRMTDLYARDELNVNFETTTMRPSAYVATARTR